eukprot:7059911-Prymnesium_polylepis.1
MTSITFSAHTDLALLSTHSLPSWPPAGQPLASARSARGEAAKRFAVQQPLRSREVVECHRACEEILDTWKSLQSPGETLYLLYLRCICAVSILYVALYFSYGGLGRGVTVAAVYAVSLLYRCCIAAVSA